MIKSGWMEQKQVTITDMAKEVIARAVKNGYKFPFTEDWLWKFERIYGEWRWFDSIIFSKDFGLAYFGDGKKTKGKWVLCYEWEYHLREMAVMNIEERIMYLYRYR